MKKILLCVAIVSISLFGYTSYADEDFSPTETLVADIVKTMPSLSLHEQLAKLEKYDQMVAEIDINTNDKQKLIAYINQKEEDVVKQLDEQSKSTPVIGSKQAVSTTWTTNTGTTIQQAFYETPANTNWNDIVSYWLWVNNAERTSKGIAPLTYDKGLEMTASIRAENVRDLGQTTHKRNKSDPYYSYDSIKDWFADLGIVFDDTWTSFSESIGRGYYNCKSDDKTQGTIKAISSTWKFFMSEKSRKWPHYRAIMTPEFTKIGLWVSIDPKTKKYYLVTHYSR